MNKQRDGEEVVVTNSVTLCLTPEPRLHSPSRDSDSEAASPVPFLSTQDGAEGETDVVWNFYTPKADYKSTSRVKSSTPLSRRSKRLIKPRIIDKPLPKRKTVKSTLKTNEIFKDLIELNQNIHELIAKKSKTVPEKLESYSEDDVFNDSPDNSPKTTRRSQCLRKNVLSSNFSRPDTDTALESDDSMNECLIKASQIVEENIFNHGRPRKSHCDNSKNIVKTEFNMKMDNDSMDAILNSIKIESPAITRTKKCESPLLHNDSFDSIVGNLNDSALAQITQMNCKNDVKINRKIEKIKPKNETVCEVKIFIKTEGSPSSKSLFGRHNSMPESPSVINNAQSSNSEMVFGRYNSMPYEKNNNNAGLSDSPIRCTPEEIKKKHQLAREKLMAKRLFPSTENQNSTQLTQSFNQLAPKRSQFQLKVASASNTKISKLLPVDEKPNTNKTQDLKSLIEKKRQEALLKLRRRQPQNKLL